jgi:putative transposase
MLVKRACETLNTSERQACRALSQLRSTQRFTPNERADDKTLIERMLALVGEHPRYGYRRICALLRGEGWRVNRKRVYRLWRQEGLKVPRKQRKRRRLGNSGNGCVRHQSEHIDHVWSYDFVMDQTIDGRPLKLLPIVDEYTRECLSLDVARSIKSADVIETLRHLFAVRGAPRFIRSDNGPEFIAHAVRDWLEESGVETLYIEPGSPWENGYCESFNSRLRDELLDRELFMDLREAKVVVEDFRLDYNHRRPHSALEYVTPASFADEAKRDKIKGDRAVGKQSVLVAETGSATLRLPQQPKERTEDQTPTLIAPGT